MKLYAVIAFDAPGSAALRTAHLAAHLAHIEASLGNFAVAGPLNDAHDGAVGSLLVIKAESEADARRLFEEDPYFRAGVWSSIVIHPFAAVAGDWVGGKGW